MAFKLLAVLAMAGGVAHAETPRLLPDGAPAAGNTMGKGPPEPEPDQVASTPVLTAEQSVAVRVLGAKLGTLLGMFTSDEPVVTPRLLHGRPACGNVASRAPRPRDCS